MKCPTKNFLRSGISIIEVLTSIVVAMIGVFGVMILIPFAVQQAKTGLDSDMATIVGKNAISQFEIAGYRNPGYWFWLNPDNNMIEAVDPDFPRVFSIDPLAVTENGDEYAETSFPFNLFQADEANGADFVGDIGAIDAANLSTPTPTLFPMTIANARRMFRTTDDLVFGESKESSVGLGDADLNGPQQVFDYGSPPDLNGDGIPDPLRRQSIGRLSWSAIVVPVKDDYTTAGPTSAWKYRMYVLVYKDRPTATLAPALRIAGEPGVMVSARLDPMLNAGPANPLGTVYLKEDVELEGAYLRKDDWVMLVNKDLSSTAEAGFDYRVAFCRVVGFANAVGGIKPTISLDGPNFNFGDVASGDVSETYVVHLKDVISVYERSFTPEGASNWNLSAN